MMVMISAACGSQWMNAGLGGCGGDQGDRSVVMRGSPAGLPSLPSLRKCGLRGTLLCSVLGRGGWMPLPGEPPGRCTTGQKAPFSCHTGPPHQRHGGPTCLRTFAHAIPPAGTHLLLLDKLLFITCASP